MRERPILFSGPMVRAILEGRKTQTRRVVKPELAAHFDPPRGEDDVKAGYPWICGYWEEDVSAVTVCPYGQPGDSLWVKETTVKVEDHGYTGPVYVESDEGHTVMDWGLSPGEDDVTEVEPHQIKLRPSIYMTRKMSRITLEVVSVRVEQLQDISEADAAAEGVEVNKFDSWPVEGAQTWRDYTRPEGEWGYGCGHARGSYSTLWESINGPGSWDANPWVWVVGFKRI